MAAVPTCGVLLFDSLACPLTGHHTLGAWTFGSAGAAGAAMILALGAVRLSKQFPPTR